ncbi:hypothetical protein Q4553_13315 [Tenacibaculum soleae]|uniref:hypothetical protein n=1 Tax=Tenacibaculum soleae TaxID=447689 RepID=UPI0026E202E6|nr:hypothetical protein [Tenacibaculum soleae]MDO6745542.1 hypothetical protein [Tenacibaculum soleae]
MQVVEKHLDYIQSVISRHNSNSFMIKGWTITIVSAIFALAGTLKEPILAIIPIMPIIIFWYLDSFYLANERCYISLYNCATSDYILKIKNKDLKEESRESTSANQSTIDLEHEVELKSSAYSMNHNTFKAIIRNNITDTFWSTSIKWFYIMLLLFSVSLFIGMIILEKNEINEPQKISLQIENNPLNLKIEPDKELIYKTILKDSIIITDTIKK